VLVLVGAFLMVGGVAAAAFLVLGLRSTAAESDEEPEERPARKRKGKEQTQGGGESSHSTEPPSPPPPLPPPPKTTIVLRESVEPYAVTGTTLEEIRADIDRQRPATDDGQRYDATTRWYVSWSYPRDQGRGGCATGDVTVTVTVTIKIPEYHPPPSAPQKLRDDWNRYATALRLHENGHRDFGVRTGEQVERELEALRRESSCATLDDVANRTGHAVIARFVKDEAGYDKSTEHGATQGARFPCYARGAGCVP
jgi:predicted secreted Zn-dependent protease